MNGHLPPHTTTSLAMEQQSWMRQIEHSLQGVADSARDATDAEPSDTQEARQLIERALLMGAQALQSMPRLVS
jgi:hypothetical protein